MLGDIRGMPIGMRASDGKTGFRVEFDGRSGAHINVWSGKEKDHTSLSMPPIQR